MPLFRSILCPIDFSDHSIQALRLAIGLAARESARLSVLTVNEPLLVEAAAAAHYGSEYVGNQALREARDLFNSLIPSRASWVPAPNFIVRTGKVDEEILDCAAEQNADLIAIGTHGVGGYRKMFFGSITERVLRRSSVPVLAVPLAEHRPVVFSDSGPAFHLSRILVPIDLGPGSDRQVRLAVDIGRHFGASVLVMHVVPELRAHGGLHDAMKAHERRKIRLAHDWLERLAAENKRSAVVETRVSSGRPADEIAGVAIEQNVGLILMGLTGEGASAHRPGSVAYRVLTMAPAPVLAVPPEFGELKRQEAQTNTPALLGLSSR